MLNWLYTWLGFGNGPIYNFWSGIFGDLTIFGAMLGLYLHRMCHDDTCHRWGRHTINGSPYCAKHKPAV